MPTDAVSVRAIFDRALEISAEAERAAFLDQACANLPEVRGEVEALLKAHSEAGSFLESPAAGLTRTEYSPAHSDFIGAQIGAYKLLQQLGEGGMGIVYMAQQERPVLRTVALKIIKPGMDSTQVIARFEAERQALAMMEHPNIAKVLDAGTTDSARPYFVMELVKGMPITQYADEHRLTPRQRLELFIPVCQAVQHAHQKGIIHRDLKPSNVLVADYDDRPVPKVIDFGVAKAVGQHLTEKTMFTQFGQVVGTIGYMSPEQAKFNQVDIDTRTDIYSLGVLLYELLTGETPFDHRRLRSAAFDEMLRIIREEDPPKPSARLSTTDALPAIAASRNSEPAKLTKLVRGDLDWIVMKCLDKDRSRRYDTATGLALDVQRHLDGETVVAAPPSVTYRVAKFARRHRTPVLATSLAALAAVLGTALYIHGIRSEKSRTEDALKIAEVERGRAQEAQNTAEQESRRARHAAAMADARYLVQQSQLPAAIDRATQAWELGQGKWEDGYLLDEILNASRRDWTLIGQLDLAGSARGGSLIRVDEKDYLAVAHPHDLQLYDARTSEPLRTAPFERADFLLATKSSQLPTTPSSEAPATVPGTESAKARSATAKPRVLLAVSGKTITAFDVPSLKQLSTKQYSNTIARAVANDSEALLVHEGGLMRVVDAVTLEDRGTQDWVRLPGAEAPEPTHIDISPGGRVLAQGRVAWQKPLLWDRPRPAHAESLQWLPSAALGEFAFIDDNRVVVWNHSTINGTASDDLFVYAITDKLERIGHQELPVFDVLNGVNADSKEWVQAWQSKGEICAGFLSGDFGFAQARPGSGESQSWRYGRLWPIGENRVSLLCQDLEHGLLVLRTSTGVQIFDQSRPTREQDKLAGYTATPCQSGMLRVSGSSPQVGLTLVPYAPDGQTHSVTLQWLTDDLWIPWSLASTPDASTVVVLAQQAEGAGRFGDRFGPMRAVVYRPGGWDKAPATWPIAKQFAMDVKSPRHGVSRRLTLIDPTGRTLLFTCSYSPSVRYSLGDGQKLSTFNTNGWVARAPDGRFLAVFDRDGTIYTIDVATGQRTDVAHGYTTARGICVSADGLYVLVALPSEIRCLEITTGREIWSRTSGIMPLAWPAKGGNRFVGFREDRGWGGSVVLADTESCEPVALLNSAAEYASEAYFSPSGRELMLMFSRWRADVLRMLSPEQLLADLQRPEHTSTRPHVAAMPAQSASTTTSPVPKTTVRLADSMKDISDLAALESHIGSTVIAEATIDRVAMTRQHNSAIVNMEKQGPDKPDRVVVFVPPDVFPQMEDLFGKDFFTKIDHRRVQVRGQLNRYQNHMQIVLKAPADWAFLDSSTQPSASDPK